MAEVSKYSYYSYMGNNSNNRVLDEIDDFVSSVEFQKEYDSVRDIITKKWNNVSDGVYNFPYPNLNKSVQLNMTQDRIEIRVFKDSKMDFGMYWQLKYPDEEE